MGGLDGTSREAGDCVDGASTRHGRLAGDYQGKGGWWLQRPFYRDSGMRSSQKHEAHPATQETSWPTWFAGGTREQCHVTGVYTQLIKIFVEGGEIERRLLLGFRLL